MTHATRTALEQVHQILHDAGWDAPTAELPGDPIPAPQRELLEHVVSGRLPVEDAGRAMGLAPAQTREMFLDAVNRLRQLAPTS